MAVKFIAITMLCCSVAPAASAEHAKIFGMTGGMMAKAPGAFVPAGTDLSCMALDDSGRCFDGKTWHQLYPLGPRRYSKANGAQVSCIALVGVKGDCWTGEKWYRLPQGHVLGVTSLVTGAFTTTPLE